MREAECISMSEVLNSNIRCIEMYNDLVKIYTEAVE